MTIRLALLLICRLPLTVIPHTVADNAVESCWICRLPPIEPPGPRSKLLPPEIWTLPRTFDILPRPMPPAFSVRLPSTVQPRSWKVPPLTVTLPSISHGWVNVQLCPAQIVTLPGKVPWKIPLQLPPELRATGRGFSSNTVPPPLAPPKGWCCKGFPNCPRAGWRKGRSRR